MTEESTVATTQPDPFESYLNDFHEEARQCGHDEKGTDKHFLRMLLAKFSELNHCPEPTVLNDDEREQCCFSAIDLQKNRLRLFVAPVSKMNDLQPVFRLIKAAREGKAAEMSLNQTAEQVAGLFSNFVPGQNQGFEAVEVIGIYAGSEEKVFKPEKGTLKKLPVEIHIISLRDMWKKDDSIPYLQFEKPASETESSHEESEADPAPTDERPKFVPPDPDKLAEETFSHYLEAFRAKAAKIESEPEAAYRCLCRMILTKFERLNGGSETIFDFETLDRVGVIRAADVTDNDVLRIYAFDELLDVREFDEQISHDELKEQMAGVRSFIEHARSGVYAAAPSANADAKTRIAYAISTVNSGNDPDMEAVVLTANKVINPFQVRMKIGGLSVLFRQVSLFGMSKQDRFIPEIEAEPKPEIKEPEIKEPEPAAVSQPAVTENPEPEAELTPALAKEAPVVIESTGLDGIDASDAETFRKKLLNRARTSGTCFTWLCDGLEDAQYYEDIQNAQTGCIGGVMLSGWALDDTNNTLALFVYDHDGSAEPGTFAKADYDRYLGYLKNFLAGSVTHEIEDEGILDNFPEALRLAYTISTRYKEACAENERPYSAVDMNILTLRKKIRNFTAAPETFCNVTCRVKCYDYEDFFELVNSSNDVRVDFMTSYFGGKPIHLLAAVEERDSGYASYVGRISGLTLARIYEHFGQRVLASNVRAFLMTTNAVNRGIKRTVSDAPKQFFAYNNGICVVCDKISTELSAGITKMQNADDFQIVNGGQTTATLHYVLTNSKNRREAEKSLSEIFVPIKLSVVPASLHLSCGSKTVDRQEFIRNISLYANSQSKVSDSDLTSNTQFQILFQKLAYNTPFKTPDVQGMQYWFYERARGEYKVAKLRDKSKNHADFLKQYPQKFTKSDLAKWLLSWAGVPDYASIGGEKAFQKFNAAIVATEETDKEFTFCSQDFYRSSVAKGILFRTVDDRVFHSAWYQADRAFKINIVEYSLGLLAESLKRYASGWELDWRNIWNCQAISPALYPLIDLLTRYAKDSLNREDRETSDIGEWVKKEKCWDAMCELFDSDKPQFSELRTHIRTEVQRVQELLGPACEGLKIERRTKKTKKV